MAAFQKQTTTCDLDLLPVFLVFSGPVIKKKGKTEKRRAQIKFIFRVSERLFVF